MLSPVISEMPAPDPQEQRAVRRGRLAPQARHRQGEDVVESEPGSGPDAIRVEAEAGDLALREVGVDVLAVHRRGDQQRQRPQEQRAVQLAARHAPAAERESAEHQPGQRHHHRAGGGHRQRHRLDAGGKIEQPHPERRILDHRPRAGAQRADGHQHRAGGAEHPGTPQRTRPRRRSAETRPSSRRRATGRRPTAQATVRRAGHPMQRSTVGPPKGDLARPRLSNSVTMVL